MATDFIMPQLPAQQQQQQPYYAHQPQQRQQYHPQQQPSSQPSRIPTTYQLPSQYTSPVSPLGTPTSTSRSYLTRQIRPLYVPAVLRPTEFPSKAPPPRAKSEDEHERSEQVLRPNGSFMSLGGLSAFGRLSRRSTGDSATSVDSNWDLGQFPQPTSAPTRQHWKPDQESTVCDHATCKRHFSYFTRRHHCRKCGNIFCDTHSAFEVPLDQDADYNPRGVPSRACAHCYAQFKEWRSRASSQPPPTSHDSPENVQQRLDTPASPVSASPVSTSPAVPSGLGMPLHSPDAAHSVPRDWNWSTF